MQFDDQSPFLLALLIFMAFPPSYLPEFAISCKFYKIIPRTPTQHQPKANSIYAAPEELWFGKFTQLAPKKVTIIRTTAVVPTTTSAEHFAIYTGLSHLLPFMFTVTTILQLWSHSTDYYKMLQNALYSLL